MSVTETDREKGTDTEIRGPQAEKEGESKLQAGASESARLPHAHIYKSVHTYSIRRKN